MKDLSWWLNLAGVFLNLLSGINLIPEIVGKKKISKWEKDVRSLLKRNIAKLESYKMMIAHAQETVNAAINAGFLSDLKNRFGIPF